jgi:hypothetical protein
MMVGYFWSNLREGRYSMNISYKQLIYVGVGFISGSLISASISYLYLHRKHLNDLDECRTYWRGKCKELEKLVEEDNVQLKEEVESEEPEILSMNPQKSGLEVTAQSLAAADKAKEDFKREPVDYTSFNDGEKVVKPEDVSSFVSSSDTVGGDVIKQMSNFVESRDEEEDDEEYEDDFTDIPNVKEEGVRLINQISYDSSYIHYDKVALTWYTEDEILSDDQDQLVDDPIRIIGEDAYKLLKDVDYLHDIYVRNFDMGTDYEIVRHNGSYKHTVLGE